MALFTKNDKAVAFQTAACRKIRHEEKRIPTEERFRRIFIVRIPHSVGALGMEEAGPAEWTAKEAVMSEGDLLLLVIATVEQIHLARGCWHTFVCPRAKQVFGGAHC